MEIKIDATEFIEGLEEIPYNILNNVSKDKDVILGTIKEITTPLVPLKEGTLRASASLREEVTNPNTLTFEVEYSAVNPYTNFNYAYIQHENEYYNHRYGQAHYLRDGMALSETPVIEVIKRDVNKALRKW